jgi:hypothetical protein
MRHIRKQVVSRTRREFAELDRLVARLRPADWTRRVPRPPTRDAWTVKDALAHIVYWKEHTARVIRGERRPPEMRGLDVGAGAGRSKSSAGIAAPMPTCSRPWRGRPRRGSAAGSARPSGRPTSTVTPPPTGSRTLRRRSAVPHRAPGAPPGRGAASSPRQRAGEGRSMEGAVERLLLGGVAFLTSHQTGPETGGGAAGGQVVGQFRPGYWVGLRASAGGRGGSTWS